jgi:hypothetical protein
MNEKVLLPTIAPVFSTYHYHMISEVVSAENPHLHNWFLNNYIVLKCSKGFLSGATALELTLNESDTSAIPHLEIIKYNLRFIKEQVHVVIKNILNAGYYVVFEDVDDYYIEGKSWYKKKHFNHDGLICGYDDTDMTYSIMAYDQNWICRVFKTPQHCLEEGINSVFEQGVFGSILAIKAKQDIVQLDVKCIKTKLVEHLHSDLELYSPLEEGTVFGHVAHDYAAMYLDKLYDGSIPFMEKDRRMFRLIWEHKRCMWDRIIAVELELNLKNKTSTEYKEIVEESNLIRMMYAKYVMKQNDELLPIIKSRLLNLAQNERKVLEEFISQIESEDD